MDWAALIIMLESTCKKIRKKLVFLMCITYVNPLSKLLKFRRFKEYVNFTSGSIYLPTLTLAGQFLTPDWKMWVVAVLVDTISKNMLTQTHVRNENHV